MPVDLEPIYKEWVVAELNQMAPMFYGSSWDSKEPQEFNRQFQYMLAFLVQNGLCVSISR